MIPVLVTFVLGLSPLVIVAVLLELARRREQRIESAITRQIALTDAIAEEMGAVVAPVVSKALSGRWRVRMAVPFGRPATTSRVLAIAHRVLRETSADGYDIVLTPQPEPSPAAAGVVLAAPRVKIA